MCVFSSPSPPPPPPPPVIPPPPPLPDPPPTPVDPAVTRARTKDRQQAALAQGRSATVLTSGLGLTSEATSAKKTLLGS
jgi:hypothetical protein